MSKGRLVLMMTLAVSMAGCLPGHEVTPLAPGVQEYGPAQRAVTIETEGCDLAAGRTGSGVAVGDGLVVTVAHLIVEAERVTVHADGEEHEVVSVAALDRRLDLAVLRIPSMTIPDIIMTSVPKGARGSIVGGAGSGTVSFEVKGVVELTIEEVLGANRHARRGYELEARTTDGDSGAGAYDDRDRLIGIVFATGQDGETSWVTASSEIEEFLSALEESDTYPLCE